MPCEKTENDMFSDRLKSSNAVLATSWYDLLLNKTRSISCQYDAVWDVILKGRIHFMIVGPTVRPTVGPTVVSLYTLHDRRTNRRTNRQTNRRKSVYTLWSSGQPLVQRLEVCIHFMIIGPIVGPTVGPIVVIMYTLCDRWSNRSRRLQKNYQSNA